MARSASWRRDLPRLSCLLLLGAAVALLEGPPGGSRAADSPVDAIAKKIARQMEAQKSVELRVQTKIANSNPPPTPVPGTFDTIEEHYIETAGKRRCDIVYTSEGKTVRREEHFWNGAKAAAVTFAPGPEQTFDAPEIVKVGKNYYKEDAGERMERPSPILFLHVGREPLYKAILKAKPTGTGTILGRECDLFLFEQVPWRMPQDQLYYLDRETGLPLSVEGYPNYAERDKQKQHWVWKAESLDRVGEFDIPLKTVQIHFDQENQPAYTWTSTVQSVEFNKLFPASMFWPADTPDVTFIDTIKKKTVRGDSSKRLQNFLEGADPAQAAPTAQLPLSSADWAARIFLGAGAALVVVGLAAAWRRRR